MATKTVLGDNLQGQTCLHPGQNNTIRVEEKMVMHLGIQLSRFTLSLTTGHYLWTQVYAFIFFLRLFFFLIRRFVMVLCLKKNLIRLTLEYKQVHSLIMRL